MSMIEVDPKLFITCRLCLEDMGQYQIVPVVQNQIKYCFDIDVEPFDGLPQLICKKCENILCGFYKTKKAFIDKQNDLKIKIGERKVKPEQPQQETVSSSQQNDSEIVSSNQVVTSKKRKAHIPSTSSDAHSAITATSDKSLKRSGNRNVVACWELDYKKVYGCKLCKRQFRHKIALKSHNTTHNSLKEKYHYIFNNNCMLKMEKLDGKPNMTGRNTVVHNNRKIIEDGDLDYYVMYKSKQLHYELEQNKYEASDDSEEDFVIRKKRLKKRLLSKSSTDTVVIEPHNDDSRYVTDDEKPIIELKLKDPDKSDCINIDDSSDSSSDKNNKIDDSPSNVSRKNIKAKFNDYKTIQSIISMCQAKYQQRLDGQMQNKKAGGTNNSESQLKRKILSIGRKVVNRQSMFSCTGLIRFMEHKNLELKWVPKTHINWSNDKYYIRIMTKRKSNTSITDNNEIGWTNLSSVVLQQNLNVPSPSSELNIQTNEKGSVDASGLIPNDIYSSNVDHKNKLLNANPVANPKQLPKKTNTNELKPILTINTIHSIPNDTTLTPVAFENSVENVGNVCMPIITSTTSLAPPVNETDNRVTVVPKDCETKQLPNTAIQTLMPRIKVKPVSELLSKEVLKNMLCDNKTNNSVVNQDQQTNVICTQQDTVIPEIGQQQPVPPLTFFDVQGAADTNPVEKPTTPASGTVASEYVILDTVELPNTKTRSPFIYLTNLLQIHNITLLDTKETLSPQFTCLIKFKVLYKQETKDLPVILCLSLFCHMNTFCMKVRDRNQDNIDMDLISANWQWEIIKIFKGDVVKKLLQNAQKSGQEVYEYTKSLLCLIQSINFMKET